MERLTLIEDARRAAGLTQAELAARAGTTQSAISMYERRRKVPLLDVAERLMQAAGYDLGRVTSVSWEAVMVTPISGFSFPDRLWRAEVPQCFDTVVVSAYPADPNRGVWNLRTRDERTRLYEILLVRGNPPQMMRFIDAALLVDVWDEMDLPPRIRAAWEPAVRAASKGEYVAITVSP